MKRLDALTLPLWGSRLIEASAGTGKTWTIATLYLRLILGHGSGVGEGAGGMADAIDTNGEVADDDPDATASGPARALTPSGILVMTFTIAATRELSDRIRDRLLQATRCFRGDAAVAADDPVLAALVASYPMGAARDAAAWRLATAAEGMDDASVFTIDAWVQRMLREHAFESGSLFDEEVQPDEAEMLAEAARDYWRQEIYRLDASSLDDVLAVWADPVALAADVRKLRRFVQAFDPRTLTAVCADLRVARDAVRADARRHWSSRLASMRDWLHAHLASAQKPFNATKLKAPLVDAWLDAIDAWLADTGSLELAPARPGAEATFVRRAARCPEVGRRPRHPGRLRRAGRHVVVPRASACSRTDLASPCGRARGGPPHDPEAARGGLRLRRHARSPRRRARGSGRRPVEGPHRRAISGRADRRVPGHVAGAVPRLRPAVSACRQRPRHGAAADRRPEAVDLQLPRCRHPELPAGACRDGRSSLSADDQSPLDRAAGGGDQSPVRAG